MELDIQIQKLRPEAKCPTRATAGSAGLDLYACLSEPVTIEARQRVMIPTGIAAALPSPEYALFLFARSGLATKFGITLSNTVGVVDSDYRGEIKASLCNLSDKSYTVEPFERIAQMVVMPVVCANLIEVPALPETERDSGGFGSTGK